MRYTTICLLTIFLHPILTGQTVTTTYSEEQEVEKQKLVNAYSCFFNTYEDVSRIWKVGYTNFTNDAISNTSFTLPRKFNIKSIDIGMEQRIGTGISLGGYMRVSTNNSFQQLPINDYQSILSADLNSSVFNVEARWYFQKREQIQQGLSGNNLSGIYLGLNGGVDIWTLEIKEFQSGEAVVSDFVSTTGTNYQTYLAIGWQQQVKHKGYINFRLGSGLKYSKKDLSSFNLGEDGTFSFTNTDNSKWFLDYQVTWGTTLGGKSKAFPSKDCTVLEYFEEDKQLWKFDVFNLIDGFSNKGMQGKLSLEYERKIGNTPFSINPLAELYYSIPFSENQKDHQFNFGTELRYYFSLKRQIQKGLTGNGLFASYVATHIYHAPETSNRPRIGLQIGGQTRLFKKLYFDGKVLFDTQTHSTEDNGLLDRLSLQYKIGFAF